MFIYILLRKKCLLINDYISSPISLALKFHVTDVR